MIDWKAINSPDYFNSACTHTYSGVPINRFGCSYSKSGSAFVGISLYQGINSEYKEYFYQQLQSTLITGNVYCLSFYITKADRKEYAIKNIGAYFSNTVLSVGSLGYISANPQVVNQSGFITDTVGWTQIQGCFTAQGGELYITIGNFNNNANTDTLYTGTNNPIPSDPQYAYYYIDDITLIDQSTVGVKELSNGASVNVYPNPANDVLNIDIKNFNKENLSIKIVDVIGKEVLKSDFKNQIDISFLEQGIYFVSIQQNDKTLGVKKVVKE